MSYSLLLPSWQCSSMASLLKIFFSSNANWGYWWYSIFKDFFGLRIWCCPPLWEVYKVCFGFDLVVVSQKWSRAAVMWVTSSITNNIFPFSPPRLWCAVRSIPDKQTVSLLYWYWNRMRSNKLSFVVGTHYNQVVMICLSLSRNGWGRCTKSKTWHWMAPGQVQCLFLAA